MQKATSTLKPLLLVTGGTGTVGRLLLPELRQTYRLRITAQSGRTSQANCIAPTDEILTGDLGDAGFASDAVTGCDAMLHLAANASPAATASEALANTEMSAHLLAAATKSSVGRVVLASSVHATGLDYRDGKPGISTAETPRPCCHYGASKVAIEALAKTHQHAEGNSVSCLRLGLAGWPLIERQYAHTWLSPADLSSLVSAALSRPAGFGIYNAVSADAATRWDVQNARRDLGWAPRDRWEVDFDRLPLAATAPCQLFTVPAIN